MARIYRDAYGVPHVRATTILDLASGQGEVVARDRAWQMEWLRRRATGTTAEILGRHGLPWDRFARRSLLVDTARRAYDRLDDETATFVAAYADGVNAGLHADAPELATLGIEPQSWPVWMPLATFHAQHILFASLGSELWARRAQAELGDDAALISHEGPMPSGSNAWAVGGGRTASGLPLIGGDPHRVIESPGVYLQIRLACEEFDVAGFTFAGVPGVQHFAHAGDVAWAITNAMADYQDVRDAGPVIERWDETITVRDGRPEEVEVAITGRGPVFTDGVSYRGTSTILGDLGFGALLPLLRSRTVDDVDRALDGWVEPVNNAVIADRHGTVRYRLAGRIPLRTGDDWTGWHGPNRAEIPADGQVVTANERRGPESDAVGADFAPSYRADRIHALLDGRDGLTPADFRAIHNDTYLATVPLLRGLVPGEFDDWDARMDADSADAARFAAWRNALVRRIAAEPVFAKLHEPVADPVHAPWLDVTARIGLALPSLVAAGEPYGIELRELARLALEDARDHPATWGDTHVAAPVHAFEVTDLAPPELPRPAVDGDGDCVRCTGSLPGVTDEAYRGSVARYVWDLADRDASGWVVPLGADGRPGHAHHHDQLPLWVAGDLVPLVTDWSRLAEERT
jgi:penicillin amidase